MSRRVIDRWKWACAVAAPALNGTQRAVLLTLAAHAPGGQTIIGQETLAACAGVTDRGLRKALDRLEALNLISAEPRPGRTTVWTINTTWTPEPEFRGQRAREGIGGRNSSSRVPERDPGTTPELPRNSSSDERGSERTTAVDAVVNQGRGSVDRAPFISSQVEAV